MDNIAEDTVHLLATPLTRDATWDGGAADPAMSGVAPYRLFNVGNEYTVELLR